MVSTRKGWTHPTRQEIAELGLVYDHWEQRWFRAKTDEFGEHAASPEMRPSYYYKSKRGKSGGNYCSKCRGPHVYKHGRP